MKYAYTCNYCDNQWLENYSYNDRCGKCGSKELKIRPNEKIDYYDEKEEKS
jgi:hypothetical protein